MLEYILIGALIAGVFYILWSLYELEKIEEMLYDIEEKLHLIKNKLSE